VSVKEAFQRLRRRALIGARGVAVDPRLLAVGEYVGSDIHPGPNVDVVGDAHQLSKYVSGPLWKAVLEINAVLADGGLLFVATHQSWPPHELPGDFWRYSPAAFEALLNRETGFEIIRAERGLPEVIVPMVDEPGLRGLHLQWNLTAADVIESEYPIERK
jgi:hypothetical protein